MEELQQDALYQKATEALQAGQWREAIAALEALKAEYGSDPNLASLLDYAHLKSSMEDVKPEPVRRRWFRLPRRLTRRLAMVITLILVALALLFFYQRLLQPTDVAVARVAQVEDLMQRGEQALADGLYNDAAAAFQQVLEMAPDNSEAQQKLAESQRLQQLADAYEEAVRLRKTGRLQEALAKLEQIEQQQPGFRDVPRLIAQTRVDLQAEELFQAAQQAFAEGRYLDAVTAYEGVRSLSASLHADEVRTNLLVSYIEAGKALVAQEGAGAEQVRQARELFEKALTLKPGHREASQERELADAYLTGHDQVERGNWDAAITALRPLVQQRPQYGGGSAVKLLYRSYIERARIREDGGDLAGAWADYDAAARLPVDDGSAAREAQRVGLALTPTPTPTPTATPTPTPTPLPTPTPVPPTPTPVPMTWYPGWIVFKSDRGGEVALYAMRADGSGVRRVANDWQLYNKLYANEAWFPDGMRRVYVESPPNDARTTAIYAWRYDVPPYWLEAREQLLDNSAINYQPVVSPDGTRIAFVSEKSGGDDIWLLTLGNPEPVRLTWNTWEWDKHPSWSPDGSQIVFWSNRETGRKQIWVMKADGSNQHNISNNEYNDWDPVWVKELRPQAEETEVSGQ